MRFDKGSSRVKAETHLVADELSPLVEPDSLVLPQALLQFWIGEQVFYARADGEVFEADRGVVLLQERDRDRELRLPVTAHRGSVVPVHLWLQSLVRGRVERLGDPRRQRGVPEESEVQFLATVTTDSSSESIGAHRTALVATLACVPPERAVSPSLVAASLCRHLHLHLGNKLSSDTNSDRLTLRACMHTGKTEHKE